MICFICSCCLENTNLLVRHLKLIHGLLPGKSLRLKCGQAGCCGEFSTFSGFRKHLNRVHEISNEVLAHVEDGAVQNAVVGLPSNNDVATSSNDSSLPVCSKNITDLCASAIAQLQAAGVGQTTVNTFVMSMEEVVQDIQDQVKETALNCLSSEDPDMKNTIEQSFKDIENPFTLLNSISKRNSYFTKKWGIVQPVEKVLGVRFDNKKNRTTGLYEQVAVTDKFAYVPILQTLKNILMHPNTSYRFKSGIPNKNGIYSDIEDGQYIKNHPLFSTEKNALQIQLFYDDFETANPLGSKKGIHKLGGIYFTLRNFPPQFNSSLANIHLCALFHAQDIKTYGFDAILEPIVNDIKVLETRGIEGLGGCVRGSIVQVTGDNLGLHCLLGFVESFRARNNCRFCLIEKDYYQTVFCEDEPTVTLRTKETHLQHCKAMQSDPTLPHVCGVKRTCLLNTLQYFSVSDNFSVDIMHDVLEGVAQFELKLVLRYVQESFLTAKELDGRLHSFNYGYMERRNRPPAVKLDDQNNDLGINAIQCWCLLRNVPLMFGDVVPQDDKYWQLLLLLLQIVNIVFSPILTEGLTVYLKHLIAEHHRLFKCLFPEKNLLPKHHLLTHYPRCIRNIGPIVHMWSMRYESKHNFFKTQQKCFKNITLTLAKKHQNCMAYNWQDFNHDRIVLGPGKTVSLSDLNETHQIASKLHVPPQTNVLSVKWVKYNGTEYRSTLIICGEVTLDLPVFYKIKDIVVRNECVLLVASRLKTVYFDEHLYAYRIDPRPSDSLKVFNVNELVYYKPFDLQMSYGSANFFWYVVPYCNLVQIGS
ncbi:uncharacterized protein LOC127508052 isoform X1 [Ctenopharyngodon idella]|uniref:uncharacterized protein LOC127508052 isoform X1 n=1 Tax=Ctenopharyngodon idella TaxID=7959 RepID=UPI00222EFB3B|nr:uncharacterized protein LOC127508052 isoform X1 [Ctenopharyngodon idella]XP_051741575.1 uncharacterized protein LOC127508052 isoform X1 [Ctenopharyngodon idella]